MNELPLIFDESIDRARPQDAGLETADADRPPWPWWMAPARLIGRFHPRLRAAAAADAFAFRRLPRIIVLVAFPLAVVALAGVVSATHATSDILHVARNIDWLRLQVDDVYTEAPLFMLAAIAMGALSPALGVLLVLVFGVSDIAASTTHPSELTPFPSALAGRLVAIWLLWLLCVEIPIVGRQLAISWRTVAGNRFVVAGLASLSTGAFVWIWTQAATVLVRPIFTWSSIPGVTLEAVQPAQVGGLVFAVVGGLVAGLVALVRGPSGLFDGPTAPAGAGASRGPLRIVGGFVWRIIVAALLTIGLGGLISFPLEAAILFLALLAAAPLARFVADRTPVGKVVSMLPPIARYVVAAVLVFGLSIATISPLYTTATFDSTGTVPQFFSVIVAVIIGMFVVQLLTTPSTPGRRSESTPAGTALVAAVLAGASTLLFLAAPLPVYADNCSNLSDCWGTPFLAALAASSVPFLLWSAFTHREPTPDKRIWPGNRSEKPPEMPPGYRQPTIKPPPPGTYPADNKPLSEQAVGSSGAGTKA